MKRDIKYLLAYTGPISVIIGLYFQGLFFYSAVIYAYIMIPVLELFINNQRDDDNFNGTYNTWNHVVGTVSGTDMKTFVNGSAAGTATFSGSRQTNSYALRLGGIYSAYSTDAYHLDGKMGAARIYSRALSAAEIENNYKTHKERYS